MIEQDAAETVRMIFDLRQSGESVMNISRRLNREQIPSPQQRRYRLGEISHEKFSGKIVWTPTIVSKILHNETYTGTLIRGKYDCRGKSHKLLPKDRWTVYENAHAPIIGKERFEIAEKKSRKGLMEKFLAGLAAQDGVL